MVSVIAIACLILPLLYLYSTYRSFSRHLSEAKQSGIRYVIVPVFIYKRLWLFTQELWLPLIRKLPSSWTAPWITYIESQWPWAQGFRPFKDLDADTFLAVSPGGSILWTCEPEAISQISTRRNDFPKPIEMYKVLNVYGPNVVGTEGMVWRHHRKTTAPQFTEENNRLVWSETLDQMQLMMDSWMGSEGQASVPIPELSSDIMRVTLHIISRAGFGKKLLWPGQGQQEQDESISRMQSSTMGTVKVQDSAAIPPGHLLSYKDALAAVLSNLLWIILLPHSLLKNSPLQMHKRAWSAFTEWGDYMNELMTEKKAAVRDGTTEEGLDLMGALVRGAGISNNAPNGHVKSSAQKATSKGQLLSDDEIIGNAFVFLLAGHETTAGSLNHAILYLACDPSSQLRLQKDLDSVFGDRPVKDWDFEKDIGRLFNGMAGAVMSETLRLMPPVIAIPKSTQAQPQALTLGGKRVVVPANTYIMLDAVAAHRNPKYWPGDSSELDEFQPDRWFTDTASFTGVASANGDSKQEEDLADIADGNHPSTLFSPVRGAYVPFSDGYRACLGRRFAQVEFLGALAMIFRHHSIELDVGQWAEAADVQRMPVGGKERRDLWERARNDTREKMTHGMESRRTLLMSENVRVRIVKRGQEMFPM
ncbi:MAG: hypothetical protein M1817_000949 [Caeruleum heppii]|nr:MAG: hypothetical protein M1817_000949 [Caeruleum heppii]